MPPRSGRKKKRGYGALTVCGCCAVWLCVYLAFVVYVQSVSSAGPGRPAAPTGEDTSSRALPGDEVGGRSRSLRGRITDPQVLRGLPNDVSTPPPQAPLVHHVPVAPAPAAPATVAVPPLPSAPRAPTAPETAARRPAPAIDESHRTHEAPAAASYSQPATTLQSSAVAGIAAVPVEGVVQYLSGLAKLDSATLRMKLNVSLGDVFGLQALEKGVCPASAPFLPPRPSPEAARKFRDHATNVVLWYEHLSKAGGTSFCKLAMTNMKRKEVPSYYCMPSEGNMPDARVGQWDNAKLRGYNQRKGHRIVSNEWEPFPTRRLEMRDDQDVSVFFVTSIRHPINRLLSAYRFWGVLHNPTDRKPPADRWLYNMEARAIRDAASPRGIGKGVGTGNDFIAQVGRPNFATWKFSGGDMPVKGSAEEHMHYFKKAVTTISAFDLAIPMEDLSAHPDPLADILDWHNYKDIHVVPSGKIVNNEASSELSGDKYQELWEKNRLDMLIYSWVRAVFYVRLNCHI